MVTDVGPSGRRTPRERDRVGSILPLFYDGRHDPPVVLATDDLRFGEGPPGSRPGRTTQRATKATRPQAKKGKPVRRYLFALVVAYAASVTLLAAWWGMQAWSYRRFVDALSRGKRAALPHPPA